MFCRPAGEGKLQISHSTIEKQRRDRINSLIDQLRDLVPSQGALRGPDGSEMKRPKHVVLSDTIRLLKRMQEQVSPGGVLACLLAVTHTHLHWLKASHMPAAAHPFTS
jgi:hypothetical protein